METALDLLSCYGLMYLLSQSKIAEKPRQFVELHSEFIRNMLSCSFCTGFWSGLFVFLLSPRVEIQLTARYFMQFVLFGLASSAFCYLLDNVLLWLESNSGHQKV